MEVLKAVSARLNTPLREPDDDKSCSWVCSSHWFRLDFSLLRWKIDIFLIFFRLSRIDS